MAGVNTRTSCNRIRLHVNTKSEQGPSLHPVYLEKAKATAFIARPFSSLHLKNSQSPEYTELFSLLGAHKE